MKVTPTTEMQLERAKKVIFIEADDDIKRCHIRIIESGNVVSDTIEDGQFWMLNKFMDIL